MKDIIIAVITAKRRSRRLPNKNLRNLMGKPLLLWTIEAAQKSSKIGRIIVTTEDNKIMSLAAVAGVESIKRPHELSTDTATSEDVLLHAIKKIEAQEHHIPEAVILLQPTSPLRTEKDIDKAVKMFIEKDADSLISGYIDNKSPYKYLELTDEYLRGLKGLMPVKSKGVKSYFYQNGAIYIIKTSIFMKTKRLITKKTIPFVMDQNRSIDIDTYQDLKAAESYLKRMHVSINLIRK